MCLSDIGNCTLGELIDIILEYNDTQAAAIRMDWEALRIQTTILTNLQLPKSKSITAAKLWPLPWDEKGAPMKRAQRISETTREKWKRWDEQMKQNGA